ncbi:MAG: hypothetical protein IPJ33_14720 [Gammaproteobacteria bacterium]|nr:hypothetical protein [Gammaproteobacteria bacterium]
MSMTNVFKPHPLIAAVLCLALVIVRVGGAHLHLCFEGTEPPVSYHALQDRSAHELPNFDVTHQDADIALTSDMHSRLGTAFNDLPVLLSIAVMVGCRGFDLRLLHCGQCALRTTHLHCYFRHCAARHPDLLLT